jgi:Secretion system C-terminal sorting domain
MSNRDINRKGALDNKRALLNGRTMFRLSGKLIFNLIFGYLPLSSVYRHLLSPSETKLRMVTDRERRATEFKLRFFERASSEKIKIASCAATCRLFAGLIILTWLTMSEVKAQVPGWQWATGPVGQGVASAVRADDHGNAYVAGHFLGKLWFNTDTLQNNLGPFQDVFIGEYNTQGQPLWAKNGSGYADVNGVTTDANGDVYLLGTFYNDSILFDGQRLINPNAGAQNSNIFLVKYDSLGNLLWLKNLGGINNDVAAGISTDPEGNILVTGSFLGDSLSLDNITVHHLGANDVFVLKLNPSGTALWIKNIGSAVLNGATAVCTDATGDVYLTGYFLNTGIYLGNVNNVLTSPFGSNIFVVKYDSAGTTQWARYAGGNNGNGPGGIAADASGNVYITGYFSDTIAVGGDTLIGHGLQNIFTAAYSSTGILKWAQSTDGTYIDQSTGVACDENGSAYITGYFQSDTISFGNINLINPTGNQVSFLAEYDANGNALYAVAPQGNSNNTAAALCYSNRSIIMTGNFQSAEVIFGIDTLVPSQPSIYLAKTDSVTITTEIKTFQDEGKNITVFPNPSSGNFCIKGITYGNRIEIFSMIGQCVFAASMPENICQLNLADKAKGIYSYRIINNNGNIIQGKIALQ